MSLQSHITELSRRHQQLEKELQTIKAHPGGDDVRSAEIKRRKLVLKDEIERLRQ